MRKLAFLGTLVVLAATLFIQACTTREVVGVTAVIVTVSPGSANLLEGDTQQLTAVVTDDQGRSHTGAPIEWSVVDPSIASVSPDGTVEALLRGTTEVIAEYSGVRGRATITVLQSAGVTVSPASGPTTESGGEATFTVVLDTPPDADVTIGLSSSDTGEGVVLTPGSGQLTFTLADWDVPQTVTVKGQNDALADGNIVYTIVTDPAVSADSKYDGLDPADVSFTNNDDDDATVSVSAASGPTTERGGTATFTVVLNSLPSSDVSMPLSSSNPAEGTVSPGQLTFTPLNWNAPQTVTVTGQDDAAPDGNVAYTISIGPATSSDATYDGVDPADVSVTNVDDETAGITVSPATRATTEAGGQATFTVTLNALPAADVTIGLSTNDPTEGTPSASSVTFTTSSWYVPQTVTVTGQDDDVDDGDVVYGIVTSPATSSDPNYQGIDPDDVTVTNVDDETAGIVLSPVSGPTTEAGGTGTFTVVLTSRPAADVTIDLTSTNPAEGTVAPSSITFTPSNWSVPQTVTITGQDDAVADGNVLYTIALAPAISADLLYSGRDVLDVAVTNVDDETVGIVVSAVSGPTTEAGGTASFTVVLSTAPSADVTIALSSNNLAEGIVSPATLTFTAAPGPDAWNALHTVTVTGQDDFVDDGDMPYTIVTAPATSADGNYQDLDPADVGVTNVDDDGAGVTVSQISGPTTEAGGTGQFTVVLNSQPTATVTIALTSSDTSEGTAAPSSLTFTTSGPTAWNVPQPVTVTGVNDEEADGNVTYTILTAPATSGDLRYNGIDAADVSVTNVDNETAGITVTPISGPTTEAGGPATFSVSLSSQPSANVTIGLSSSDATEGTVSPLLLTFTPSGAGTWDLPQMVTVTGVDDLVDDGDVVFTIVTAAATSGDANYEGLDPVDVSVTNNDDDTAGFTISPTGLVTTEAGDTGQFTVRLSSQPTANVTLTLSSTDPTEGLASPTVLTFTPTGATAWNVGQTVTVTGVDDAAADGNFAYAVVTHPATSSDPRYEGMNPADVSVTNVDDETPGITVSPISGPTTEGGGAATFTVVLSTQPSGNVSIALSSSTTSEGIVTPTSLTFTPSGAGAWNAPQTVTVTGVDDFVDDGNVAFSIITAPATSSDGNYAGLDAADVSVTNNDDDTAGVSISPTGVVTTEAGGTAELTVVLNSQPIANVTITLASNDPTEGAAAPPSLTFTPSGPAAWNVAQTVTVAGQDDLAADGNVGYTIVTDPVTSSDPRYAGLNPPDVSATNVDNETPSITVSPVSGPTTEDGESATFTIVLSTEPSANVTIGVSSSRPEEGTVAPETLTFTPSGAGAWNVPQTVTITGVDDDVDDGNVMYSVVTAAATSGDMIYHGIDPADVTVTNVDDDVAGFTVSSINRPTTEAGGTATFTVRLTSMPTGDVTVPVASDDPNEGTVIDPASGSLTFSPASWSSPQSVTVQGVDDLVADGNQPYSIVTGGVTSTDPKYNGQNPPDVTVTNVDDEVASIAVSPASGPTTEAGGPATFAIVLSTQPTADVTVTFESSDVGEGEVISPMSKSVTFTTSNWSTPQIVTVNGIDDMIDDGDVPYTIETSPASSADPNYDNVDPGDIALTNTDDDTAMLAVADVTVTEGNSGSVNATFTVSMSVPSTQTVTVGYGTSNGTATVAGGDYTAAFGVLTFDPLDQVETFVVPVLGDLLDEDDETFTVLLANVTNGVISDNTAVGTIQDNDPPPVLSIGNATISENAGTATLDVTLSRESGRQVTVQYSTAPGSATAPADFGATSGMLTFAPGDMSEPIVVPLVDDALDEDDEAFTVTLSDPTLATIGTGTGTVTITDGDPLPTLSIANASAGSGESGTLTFNVTLSPASGRQVTVQYATVPGSATAPADYVATSGVLTFAPAVTTQPVTVTVNPDQIDEGDSETFTVDLSNPDSALISTGTGTGTVLDDDTAGITVFPTTLATSEPAGQATFTVVLNSDPMADVSIPIRSGDLTEGTANPTSLTFTPSGGAKPWNVAQTVTVTSVNDDVDDGDQAYSVITDPATSTDLRYSGLNAADVSATNVDDDLAGIIVEPMTGLTTTEGGTATFTVVLSSQPIADVTITMTSSHPTRGTVTSTPNPIVFTTGPMSWQTPQTVTLTGQQELGDYTVELQASTVAPNFNGLVVEVQVENIEP